MSTENERMEILEMIDRGEISASQGLELLKALEDSEQSLEQSELEAGPPEDKDQGHIILAERQSLESKLEPSPEIAWEKPVVPEQAVENQEPVQMPPQENASSSDQETGMPLDEAAAIPAEEPDKEAERGEIMPSRIRPAPDFSRWRLFWQIPLWVGVGVTILSGALMYLAWQSTGVGLWFACTWFPFFLGVALMALAWSIRNLPWLHVRIQQKPGERPGHIAISLPLPLDLIAWGLRVFKHKIPNTGNVNLEEMIQALKNVSPDAPFSVDVDEGEEGERVQIYIG